MYGVEGHFLSLRDDEHHIIARYCDVRTLCALMQTHTQLYYLYVSDRAWVAQRDRVLKRFPRLVELFNVHTRAEDMLAHTEQRAKERNTNGKKKLKTKAMSTPRLGIWYVFKQWLSKGCDFARFHELLFKKWAPSYVNALLCAVMRAHIPAEERIVDECGGWYVKRGEWPVSFSFDLAPIDGRDREITVRFKRQTCEMTVSFHSGHLILWRTPSLYETLAPDRDKSGHTTISLPYVFCSAWEAFLLEDHSFHPRWSEIFFNTVNRNE
jgi:hypothetical protein